MTSELHQVAALYDVHGNLPALEAALADAESSDIDLFVLGGDLALGPMPLEVLDRLIDLGDRARYVRGNCDRLMVDAFDGRPLGFLPLAVQESIVWAAGQLQRSHRDFLAGLPNTLTLDIEGLGAVRFCHATPRSDDEIFTARTSDERLRPLISGVREAILVCGHTHMQFVRDLDGLQVVNAGSVGMPYGQPGAQWLLLSSRIQLRRTDYDGASAARRIESTTYPNAAFFATRYVLHPPSELEMLKAFEPSDSA
jgi:putative phosphoesterase